MRRAILVFLVTASICFQAVNDTCASVAGMLPARIGAVAALNPPQAPAGIARDGHDSPFLEGLKRPPRDRA